MRCFTPVCKKAPGFCAPAVMADNSVAEVSLEDERGRYVVLIFYPGDFSFVCPLELTAFNRKLPEFTRRGAVLWAISGDSVYSHLAWKRLPPDEGGAGGIGYPMLEDRNGEIARDFGVRLSPALNMRGLFIIDRSGIVRHSTVNDLFLCRSAAETLRVLDALIFYESGGRVCTDGIG